MGNKTILQQRNAQTVINPASMTKILTVLVAAEQIDESRLDDKVTITIEDTDYSYSNDCSNAGFELDEQVTVRDLFYGTILPSGAEAAVALAKYVAGSEEAFVALMNQKMEEMGLSQTAHFTNCVGLYDEAHHCSVYDMAMIMEAAMDNPFCREVLSAHTYTTSVTEQHPEGMILSNWFLRRIRRIKIMGSWCSVPKRVMWCSQETVLPVTHRMWREMHMSVSREMQQAAGDVFMIMWRFTIPYLV